MEILQELGENIRRRRKVKGLSQEKLAELADVHRTYIGAVERGEQNICFTNLCRISVALDVSLSEMLEPMDWAVEQLRYEEHFPFILRKIKRRGVKVRKSGAGRKKQDSQE